MNTIMKKIILFVFLVLAMAPFVSWADPAVVPAAVEPSSVTPIPESNVETTIGVLTNWFFAIFLIVAVWFFIWAGFNFLTANGDTEKVSKARNQVLYGVIGVLIAALAKGLVGFAMGLAKGPAIVN